MRNAATGKRFSRIGLFAFMTLLLLVAGAFCLHARRLAARAAAAPPAIVRVAIPASQYIQDPATNHYTAWLEKRCHVSLQFTRIPDHYVDDYLRLLFSSSRDDIDTVFFGVDAARANIDETVLAYGEQGYLHVLDPHVSPDTNLQALFARHQAYDLEGVMRSADGHLYYMPSLETARMDRVSQILWINSQWLKALELPIPETTEALQAVLQAFRDGDPNGNGIRDEIPLLDGRASPEQHAFSFLANAFLYNDPRHSHLYLDGEEVRFAPLSPAWREAVRYARGLIAEGLLTPQTNVLDHFQYAQIINDPRDLVGSFVSRSLEDAINPNSPDVLIKYIHVPPLKGPEGVRHATVRTPLPKVGAIITANSPDPDAAFRVLDAMLCDEASLIARYGEEGVDWSYAQTADISLYGHPATIHARTYLWNTAQNKHYMGFGPFAVPSEYLDGVTWSGYQYDQVYIHARAALAYERAMPESFLEVMRFSGAEAETLTLLRGQVDVYTNTMLDRFLTGRLDVADDKAWQTYLDGYAGMDLRRLCEAVSQANRRMNGGIGKE